ncbi:MAG TPA: hypothetical protein VLD58_09165, partial [Gemmatimonadales bacterium]|nr:hypothetical protein [Gemmatimonadales bacterium]
RSWGPYQRACPASRCHDRMHPLGLGPTRPEPGLAPSGKDADLPRMPALTISDLLNALQAAIQGLESRSGTDIVSAQELEKVKLRLDDIRLSLWAHLQRLHTDDLTRFEQRFRVRRAGELCVRLRADLDAHLLDADQPEFADLWIITNQLSQAIQTSRQRGDPGPR